MISVLVYGRNDDYGYNLDKRVALSLNNLALFFESKEDEIIFVDYNSPDELPTFPESILDTLTSKVKAHLKVVRVRPHIHEICFGAKTHLPVLEPVARNVGLRFSNPKNQWILNTNTDVLLESKFSGSLYSVLENTQSNVFIAPRFELPESVWESFDRLRPDLVLSQLARIKKSLFLIERVFGDEWNLYDAPGDFQLVRRSCLLKINGFDEKMTLGWHCDSNLNKRLFLEYGNPGDGGDLFNCYHCDHTRKSTPMHVKNAPVNDADKFIHNVNETTANLDADWGLKQHELEVFEFSEKNQTYFVRALESSLVGEKFVETSSNYTGDCFENSPLPDLHVLPFLGNEITNFSRQAKIGWIGYQGQLFSKFKKLLSELKFFCKISEIKNESTTTDYDIVVVCLASPFLKNVELNKKIFKTLAQYTGLFRKKATKMPSNLKNPKIIFIGFSQTRFERWVARHFSVSRTPFSTRVMSGYLSTNSSNLYQRAIFRSGVLNFVDFFVWGQLRNWLLNNRQKYMFCYLFARSIYRFIKLIFIYCKKLR